MSSLKELNEQVVLELKAAKLYTPKKFQTDWFAFERGSCSEHAIHMPEFSLSDFISGIVDNGRLQKCSRKNTLYHEYGHAYFNSNQRSAGFYKTVKRLFGDETEESEYDEDIHVTEDAAVSSEEDFAECFMTFMEYGKEEYDDYDWNDDYENSVRQKLLFIEFLTTQGR